MTLFHEHFSPEISVAIPEITYNILYRVPSTGTAGWHLSSDMYDPRLPGGYSAHGDWFSAWEMSSVSTTHCTIASRQRAPATTRLADSRADW